MLSTQQQQQVRVGVGVFILKSLSEDPLNPRFLIGKRKGSHGAGTYALPGGHLEYFESPEACAARETMEEVGLNTQGLRFLTATNDIMIHDQKHYVTLFFVCARSDDDQEPRVLEPEKCEAWEWMRWSELSRIAEKQGHDASTPDTDETIAKTLFTPMMSLLQQRPGIVPSLP